MSFETVESAIPDTPRVRCAEALARQYPGELGHFEQVTALSALLFGQARALHALGDDACELLCCAAWLHDIGVSGSASGHHKRSLRLILQSDLAELTDEERLVVANIARYHRKAEPKLSHEPFARLGEGEREPVRKMAALLRIADGLDRAHERAVARLALEPRTGAERVLHIEGPGDLEFAAWGARRKAGMFESVYGVQLRIQPRP